MIDGLIIKKYYLGLILSGAKTWEIRGSNTKKRGTIALIQSGSGSVVGICELVNSKPITTEDIENNLDKHCLSKLDRFSFPYKKPHAWIIKNARPIKKQSYTHPRGAQMWVKNVIEFERIER